MFTGMGCFDIDADTASTELLENVMHEFLTDYISDVTDDSSSSELEALLVSIECDIDSLNNMVRRRNLAIDLSDVIVIFEVTAQIPSSLDLYDICEEALQAEGDEFVDMVKLASVNTDNDEVFANLQGLTFLVLSSPSDVPSSVTSSIATTTAAAVAAAAAAASSAAASSAAASDTEVDENATSVAEEAEDVIDNVVEEDSVDDTGGNNRNDKEDLNQEEMDDSEDDTNQKGLKKGKVQINSEGSNGLDDFCIAEGALEDGWDDTHDFFRPKDNDKTSITLPKCCLVIIFSMKMDLRLLKTDSS